jgi:D-sedoheptulose 7-phosphate isomerase
MEFIARYLDRTKNVLELLDKESIRNVVSVLRATRDRGGRLFIIGSGGGAGHASHATCDFRKIGGFEAYCPTDNVSELTARVNDEGWDTSIAAWLEGSRICGKDCVLVFSVGGGSEERNVSMNLVRAVRLAKEKGASVAGIVGRDGGYTARAADAAIVVPDVDPVLVTALAESFQALLWHLLVSHPDLQAAPMKWESMK